MITIPPELNEITEYMNPKEEAKDIIARIVLFFNGFKNVVIQDFFVGVSDIPETKIFVKHRVPPGSKNYIIVDARNSDIANEVKSTLLKYGINGYPEDYAGNYVYCYYIDGYTCESA